MGAGLGGGVLRGGGCEGRRVAVSDREGGDAAFYFGGWREGLGAGVEGLCGTLLSTISDICGMNCWRTG